MRIRESAVMCIWLPVIIMILLPSCTRTAVFLPAMSGYGEDATAVFNMLSGYSEPKSWNRLIVAPIWMKDRFLKLIEQGSGACHRRECRL